ncbi:conserved hypothetical protein [uncultured Desulfatiglans sp.]|uniref:Uncharacterized protein n=1 Tax=Uncultured Desulfatiglans sp. TaxID=1748965 RepID=A0A653A2K7_UNCDX|nr:conserved hypothetical protein [uncultured Desulfatiglans sp.]
MESYGVIEVDLFSEEVGDADHPEAVRFREMLEDVAAEHGCFLIYFEVEKGTVEFAFDSDELMAKILRIFEDGGPRKA